MKVVLFEDSKIRSFFPFTTTRHISELRWGALTIAEKWRRKFSEVVLISNREWIGVKEEFHAPSLYMNGRLCPTEILLEAIENLKQGQGLRRGEDILAYFSQDGDSSGIIWKEFSEGVVMLDKRTELFSEIHSQIEFDLLLSEVDSSFQLHESNCVIGNKNSLFVSPTAKIFGSIINVTDGPVWIDDDTEIMEGSLIRGPFYLGKSSVVKMGAKIYGPTAIGPYCKVGGELGNVSFQGYSNKAHDGFLGNSIIGQWCNLGADTNCSNLKNNYSVVKQYDYVTQKEESTGLNFCGLMMGDYSKCGINTMWNTGSVVGVCVNFYGAGFPKKHLPDFYWGDANAGELYDLKKALETIAVVKSRRGIEVTENERQILTALHAMSIA